MNIVKSRDYNMAGHKNGANWLQRNQYLFLVMLFLIVFLLQTPYFWHHTTCPDESALIYEGTQILEGNIPYKDAVYDKPIGTFYIFAFVFSIFGKSVMFIRLLTAIVNAGTAVLVYFTGKKLFSGEVGLVASAFYGFEIANGGLEAHWGITGPYMTFFSTLAILIALIALEKERSSYFIASGIIAGISFLMKQPGGITLPIIFALIVVYFGHGLRTKIKQIILNSILVLIGFTLFVTSIVIYLWHVDALREAIRWTLLSYINEGPISNHLLSNTLLTILRIPLVFFFAIFAMVYIFVYLYGKLKRRTKKERRDFLSEVIKNKKSMLFILIWTLMISIFLIESPSLYPHTFIQLMPPLCILAAIFFIKISVACLKSTRDNHETEEVKVLKKFAFFVIICLLLFNMIGYVYGVASLYTSDDPTFELANYIQSRTNESDYVYALTYYPQLNVYSNRDAPSKYFSIHSTLTSRNLERGVIEKIVDDISINKPKYILVFNDQVDYGYEDVLKYTKDNYNIEKVFQASPGRGIYIYRIDLL